MYVVFLGAPGAGKGTQAVSAAERFGLAHIATGDLLRDAVRRETELGKRARDYMERGDLVPDDLVAAVVAERLSQPDASGGAVLDGFPRNLHQAVVLDEALGQMGKAVGRAVYLAVPEEVLVSRLSGRRECPSCRTPYHEVTNPPRVAGRCDHCGGTLTQRADDRPETVRRRLQVYQEQTEPLLRHYRDRGILVRMDGDRPIPEVARQVDAVLEASGRSVA